MFKVGEKVKINPERLKYHCDLNDWTFLKMNTESILTITKFHKYKYTASDNAVNVAETECYYPVDCLINLRKEKLKRVLCLK